MHALLRFLVRGGLVADWRDFMFLHFALPPEAIASHLPLPPDIRGGRTYVSLVSFRLERLRPGRWLPPALGRLLLRPVSNHSFLNLRAYVRGPAGPGILFLTEWIDNPISVRLGPVTYGLPYRLARMSRVAVPGAGLQRLSMSNPRTGAVSSFVAPLELAAGAGPVAAGSLDEFLLERYVAYTHRAGEVRHFSVKHPPWRVATFHLARFNATSIENEFAWFGGADFISGHLSRGFDEVMMGPPVLVGDTSAVEATQPWTAAEDQLPGAAATCLPRQVV